jgi:hypothetical protein
LLVVRVNAHQISRKNGRIRANRALIVLSILAVAAGRVIRGQRDLCGITQSRVRPRLASGAAHRIREGR